MAYIFGLVVVALFFLALHYFTELSAKQKAAVTLFVLGIVAAAAGYNAYADAERDRIADVELRYNQGKAVECNGVSVTKEGFSYSVGTQTFIGIEGTEHYGRMISAYECR